MANSASYNGVNDQVFEGLKQRLSQLGISLQGDSGKISQKGVSAEYSYNRESQTLNISNLKVGFPASMITSTEQVIGQITSAVQSSGGQVNS